MIRTANYSLAVEEPENQDVAFVMGKYCSVF